MAAYAGLAEIVP